MESEGDKERKGEIQVKRVKKEGKEGGRERRGRNRGRQRGREERKEGREGNIYIIMCQLLSWAHSHSLLHLIRIQLRI
jgi:hypothetical protein